MNVRKDDFNRSTGFTGFSVSSGFICFTRFVGFHGSNPLAELLEAFATSAGTAGPISAFHQLCMRHFVSQNFSPCLF